jgi:ABC-type lipoprotein export system ATPase subunit
MLELSEISKTYGDPLSGGTPVLNGISLSVRPGDSLAITGPSGSGKSTLLNIIGSLDRPTSGSVLFENRDLARLTPDELARLRSRRIGFVFQLHHLLPQCTVLENVLIPTLIVERDRDAAQRARSLLERVGLSHRESYLPGQLSGGERQRVAVVRALINRPGLLLADEPTGSLDRAAAENVADLLVSLNKELGVTLIVATHSLRLARRLGRALNLVDGRLGEGAHDSGELC